MREILIIGAGRSASSLINYLLDKSEAEDLSITIADQSMQAAKKFTDGHSNARAILLDVFNEKDRRTAVQNSDLVISMLPARFHIEVARDCIEFGKHMVTASYVSDQMMSLDTKAKANLLDLLEALPQAMILVSHDAPFANALSHRQVRLERGQILEYQVAGAPNHVG